RAPRHGPRRRGRCGVARDPRKYSGALYVGALRLLGKRRRQAPRRGVIVAAWGNRPAPHERPQGERRDPITLTERQGPHGRSSEEPPVGFEPTTARLRIESSTTELRWRGLLTSRRAVQRGTPRHSLPGHACYPQ